MGDGIRRDRTLTGPHLVDIRQSRQRRGGRSRGRKTKNYRKRKKEGGGGRFEWIMCTVNVSSPPIRDGTPDTPKFISHETPLSTGDHACAVRRRGAFLSFFFEDDQKRPFEQKSQKNPSPQFTRAVND